MKKKGISISILSSKDKEKEIKKIYSVKNKLSTLKVKNRFDTYVHFDIMDGKFTENKEDTLELIPLAKKLGIYADVHLMVQNPLESGYIKRAVKFGADMVTVHIETPGFKEALEYLSKSKNVKVGIAVSPDTDVRVLKKYEKKFDNILIMTVVPGKGGQKYIEKMNEKISIARHLFREKTIEIDGGVNCDTIRFGAEHRVDTFVIGSAITSAKNYYSEILKYNIINDIEQCYKREDNSFEANVLMVKEGGYGYGDLLLGIPVPEIRKVAKKYYKYVNKEVITFFLNSKYHDYRRIALFLMSLISKDKSANLSSLEEMKNILVNNIKSVNNWDLTDEAGPNILGNYLIRLDSVSRQKELDKLLESDNLWEKRIGIVSLLKFARNGEKSFCLRNIDKFLYEEYHLFQKATGWVLRELYKKDPSGVVKYLEINNSKRKLPRILLSYASEKMSKEEKEQVKK